MPFEVSVKSFIIFVMTGAARRILLPGTEQDGGIQCYGPSGTYLC